MNTLSGKIFNMKYVHRSLELPVTYHFYQIGIVSQAVVLQRNHYGFFFKLQKLKSSEKVIPVSICEIPVPIYNFHSKTNKKLQAGGCKLVVLSIASWWLTNKWYTRGSDRNITVNVWNITTKVWNITMKVWNITKQSGHYREQLSVIKYNKPLFLFRSKI